MKKIDFKQFSLYTDIARTRRETLDVREAFANVLYCRINGIQAHSLAFSIYKSDGEITLSDDEAKIISTVAAQYCTPAFIDAIGYQLNKEEKQ
jgi:hypothetical protein